jgi:ADP-ribosylglycohydrolase
MREFGTHRQPRGTWSDDSTMAFCLMETLVQGYDLKNLGNRFINWYRHGYWTPHGEVFDMGNATRQAIINLEVHQVNPVDAGGKTFDSNGNGSLMRIIPLLFYIKDRPIEQRWQITRDVSSVTHGHFIACFSCFIHLEYGQFLLEGLNKFEAYAAMIETVNQFAKEQNFPSEHLALFDRILNAKTSLHQLPEQEISSSGYVLHTLEASFYCLLKYNSYSETLLAAVNLGSDTDTTGAVTGALAGILYKEEGIPMTWVAYLARFNDVMDLIERLQKKLADSSS